MQSPGYPKAFAQALHFARSPGRELVVECLLPPRIPTGGGMEQTMSDVTLFGFPHSSFVHIVQLVLSHKEAPHTFYDLEPDMGSTKHLALPPFDRVPLLQHRDSVLYETRANVADLASRLQ